MFTGIIEDLGIVESFGGGSSQHYSSLRGAPQGRRSNLLQIRSRIFTDQKIGDSISVNGACLTISSLKNDLAGFDIMEETLKISTMGRLKAADRVNLERALKIGDRLGGHFVTGHIDCIGKVSAKVSDTTVSDTITVQVPRQTMKYIVPKGSITLEGVSLTIADIGSDNFTVCLIPHTIKNTTIETKKTGDELNIEFDILGKYALKSAAAQPKNSAITENFLKETGFC